MTTISMQQPMRPAEIDLVNQVNTNTNDIDTNKKNISQEVIDRTNADTELNSKFPVSTDNIADNSVTNTKLATEIQQQLTFLQSVPAMEFNTSNAIDIQANSNTRLDITFATTKTEEPIVLCGLQHESGNLACVVTGVTNQQFSVTVYNLTSTDVSGVTIDWLAISGR